MSQVPSNTEPLTGLPSLTSRKYNFSDRCMQCLDSSVIHLNGFSLDGQRAGLRISLSVHFPRGSSLELNFYRISRTRAALALSTLGRSTYAALSLAEVLVCFFGGDQIFTSYWLGGWETHSQEAPSCWMSPHWVPRHEVDEQSHPCGMWGREHGSSSIPSRLPVPVSNWYWQFCDLSHRAMIYTWKPSLWQTHLSIPQKHVIFYPWPLQGVPIRNFPRTCGLKRTNGMI